MAVTVEDILNLALPAGTVVVAGRAGLRTEVVWARSLRPRPPAFEALEGGELALLSTSHLSLVEGSLTLATLIARLSEVGVAALAVQGEIDGAAVGVADTLGVPLMQLPAGVSLVEVERAAIATVVDMQAELQRRASEIHRQLAQLTFEGRGLQAMVDQLAAICGKAVAIEDDRFRLQFSASLAGIAQVESIELAKSSREVADWASAVPLSSMQPPVARFSIPGAGLERFVAPIPARDGVAGYLSVIGPEGQLTELDRQAAGRGAAVCAVEVAKEAAVVEAEARLRGDLLDQLLSEDAQGDQLLVGKARRLGYDPTLPSLVLAFRAHPGTQMRSNSPFGDPERTRVQLEAAVRVDLSRRESKSLVASRGSTVVAIVPLPALPSKNHASELAEAVRQRAEAALNGYRVAVGIGRATDSAISLAASYREAEGALGIGTRVNGFSSTTYFGDLGILRLLAQVGSQSELEDFRREMLDRLEEHDRRAGGELLKTLEALFQYHGNLSRTAEQLSLHRNSLLYRLQRIAEISGHDLGDPETRLSLQVALKVRQLLEADRTRE